MTLDGIAGGPPFLKGLKSEHELGCELMRGVAAVGIALLETSRGVARKTVSAT
jgi:hypothetical protein